MKLCINVRGINASGKSTAVRQFCANNALKPNEIFFEGLNYRVMTGNGIMVIGWYKPFSNSEGCDSLKANKEQFKRFLDHVFQKLNPDIVLYEKQIWSTVYKLTREIAEIARNREYDFLALQMNISYQTALNRLLKRNGDKLKNLDNWDSRFYAVYNAKKNLLKKRIPLFQVDVEKIPEDEMGNTIKTAIQEYSSGKRWINIEKITS